MSEQPRNYGAWRPNGQSHLKVSQVEADCKLMRQIKKLEKDNKQQQKELKR
jgi:hypothetical protein